MYYCLAILGLEPRTFALLARRSNQLSYTALAWIIAQTSYTETIIWKSTASKHNSLAVKSLISDSISALQKQRPVHWNFHVVATFLSDLLSVVGMETSCYVQCNRRYPCLLKTWLEIVWVNTDLLLTKDALRLLRKTWQKLKDLPWHHYVLTLTWGSFVFLSIVSS